MAKKPEVIKQLGEVEAQEEVEAEVEPEKPQKSEEPKLPQFKNVGEGMKIKLVDGKKFKWLTVKKGDIVTIPRKLALKNKLVEVK